jgi:hypothetical protein
MTTGKFDPGLALKFPPMCIPKQAPKVLQFPNTVTYGNGLNLNDLSDDFEVHPRIVVTSRRFSSRLNSSWLAAREKLLGLLK